MSHGRNRRPGTKAAHVRRKGADGGCCKLKGAKKRAQRQKRTGRRGRKKKE